MDISRGKTVAAREDEGTILHLRDENGELEYYPESASKEDRKPLTVRVFGSFSKRFRTARQEQRDHNLKSRRQSLDAADLEDSELMVFAKCFEWDEGFTSDGKPFEYSTKNAKLLLESAPWIRAQIEDAIGDHKGFSKPASGS